MVNFKCASFFPCDHPELQYDSQLEDHTSQENGFCIISTREVLNDVFTV